MDMVQGTVTKPSSAQSVPSKEVPSTFNRPAKWSVRKAQAQASAQAQAPIAPAPKPSQAKPREPFIRPGSRPVTRKNPAPVVLVPARVERRRGIAANYAHFLQVVQAAMVDLPAAAALPNINVDVELQDNPAGLVVATNDAFEQMMEATMVNLPAGDALDDVDLDAELLELDDPACI